MSKLYVIPKYPTVGLYTNVFVRLLRTTQLPKPPQASTSFDSFEDSEAMFEYLDDDQPNFYEKQEQELKKEQQDMEESSSSYSYKTPTKKRMTATAEICVLTQKFSEYVDLQKTIISEASNVCSMVTYWGDIIQDLLQDLQDEAEERVTKLLWDLKKKAKSHE